jgi:hypothetical protein
MKDPFVYPGLRVLLLFFNEPYREFHLREITKHTMKYDFHQLGQLGGAEFPQGETKLKGDFVKREIDESFEKELSL